MEPTLISGDRVIVDAAHRRPSPDGVYAILDPIGSVVVKRLQLVRGSDPLRIRIISDNPRHASEEEPLDQISVIGRVAGRISRM